MQRRSTKKCFQKFCEILITHMCLFLTTCRPPSILLKKKLQYRCFLMNFAKFCRTKFSWNIYKHLLCQLFIHIPRVSVCFQYGWYTCGVYLNEQYFTLDYSFILHRTVSSVFWEIPFFETIMGSFQNAF